MNGVNDSGPRRRPATPQSPQNPRLAAMRVHNIGPQLLHKLTQFPIRARVIHRMHIRTMCGTTCVVIRRPSLRSKLLHSLQQTAFRSINRSERQVHLMTTLRLTFAGEDGVLLRTAEDQTGWKILQKYA